MGNPNQDVQFEPSTPSQDTPVEPRSLSEVINEVLTSKENLTEEEIRQRVGPVMPDPAKLTDFPDLKDLPDIIKAGVIEGILENAVPSIFTAYRSFGLQGVSGLVFKDETDTSYTILFGQTAGLTEYLKQNDLHANVGNLSSNSDEQSETDQDSSTSGVGQTSV